MAEPKSVFIKRGGVRLHALDHGGGGEDKPVILIFETACGYTAWTTEAGGG